MVADGTGDLGAYFPAPDREEMLAVRATKVDGHAGNLPE
jgi:hypothetical protein